MEVNRDEIPYLLYLGFVAAIAAALACVQLLSGCAPHVCTVQVFTDSPIAVETNDDIDVDAEGVEISPTLKGD